MSSVVALTPAVRRLIDSVGVGRIALSHGALPLVLVVRCELAQDQVLVQADDPALARAALAGDVVALQVDDLRADGAGCSLVLTGVLTRAGEHAVLTPSIVTRTELNLGPSVNHPG